MINLRDFAFICPIEQMLSSTPFSQYKLKSWLAHGVWDACEKFQHSLHLIVHQIGKYHHQWLKQTRQNIEYASHHLTP